MNPKKPAAPKSSPLPWRIVGIDPHDDMTVITGDDSLSLARCEYRTDAAIIVRRVNQGPAFDAMVEVCLTLSSLAPSAEGLGGHAPIGAFFIAAERARAALKLAQEARS